MVNLIRAASLTRYAEVARSVGIDSDKMPSSVGLSARRLVDPDIRIPSHSVSRLLALLSNVEFLSMSSILAAQRALVAFTDTSML